ncbi:zinc finger CCCH domain-containing protein 18-like isoform X2 [Lotus japonicus]|nr:zinc finger CCCH domain-containing protein 18-like isoform X2 [Lotus japonicus]
MDISDYTRIVFDKIQKFEPEHASKIIGYLLLQDNGEQKMAKLASCPDQFIGEVAFKVKTDLQRLAIKSAVIPILPNPQQGLSHLAVISPRNLPSPPNFQVPSPYWDPLSARNTNTNPEYRAMNYLDSMIELQKQTQLLSLEDHIEPANTGTGGIGIPSDYFGLDASAANVGGKSGRRFSSLSEFPLKICHYFNKGYCKHGTNCRYYHGHVLPENFSQMYGNDTNSEDQVFSQGSLAQLESEIIELLKQKRGHPMSIASLPMAYYDRYKKVLQADGYLTESQRHGKSGYNLTKLLEQLNGSIRLISRPHGQHAVVLAEDAPKYIREGDSAQNISASRQIYLTFPADSTFTEEDVSDYFNTFGCVEDVRIPCQQRRMFGFVTFADPETVKMILEKGNPHYVRGSRVLVKPYKEKAKTLERKYGDRGEHSVYCSPHYVDLDSELDSMPISTGNHRSIRRQLIEEQEQALEFQRRRLAQLQFLQQPLSTSPHFGVSIDELRVPDDNFNLQPSESLSSAPNDRPKQADTDSSDENSHQGFDLPDSPFSFANI